MSNATVETATTTAAPVAPSVVAPKPTPAGKKAKAPKAPKASVDANTLKSLIAYEPGILDIKLTDIEVPKEGNTTRPEGPGTVDDLIESIGSAGQQVPVVVQRQSGEFAPFKLAAGFRRVAALTQMGRETVQARVMLSKDESARVLANVIENENARKEITPLGRLAGYEALAAQGYSFAEIAALTGRRAEDFIRDHLRISKGADEVRVALGKSPDEEGYVSWAVARLILRKPKSDQAMLLKKFGHMPVEKARVAIAEFYAESKPSTGADNDEGEGEGEGAEGSSKATRDNDKVLSEAKVAKSTVVFQYAVAALVGELREALSGGDLTALEKHINTLAKAATRQETILQDLLGNKVFNAEVKRIEDGAKK